MTIESKNLWWLPSALMALAAILFLVVASYSHTGVWMALALVFFVAAGATYRRRKNKFPTT